MKNFEILNNFPISFINEAREFYELDKNNIDDDNNYSTWIPVDDDRCSFHSLETGHSLLEPLMKTFGEFPIYFAMILIGRARCGLGPVHIDPKRHAVVNIPIQVDIFNSLFFMGDESCLEIEPPESEKRGLRPGAKRFAYEPEKYEIYNLDKPVMFDAQIPHCWANWSDEERVILSVTLDCDYKEALNLIPKEWL